MNDWNCRLLRDADAAAIRQLLQASDPKGRLYVRAFDAPEVWWYGALGRAGAQLGAALQVEGTTATLLEADPAATVALGRGLRARRCPIRRSVRRRRCRC